MKQGKGLALGGLILGILAIICLFLGMPGQVISVIAGVAGIVASFLGKNQGYNKWMFIAGVCLSLIGLAISGCLLTF